MATRNFEKEKNPHETHVAPCYALTRHPMIKAQDNTRVSSESYLPTPISYPSKTSVDAPSHPLFPAVEIMYLHVGSM